MGKTALQVYCWNIQKNSKESIEAGKAQIAQAIKRGPQSLDCHGFDPQAPWVLAILENKRDGEEVGETLRAALQGQWSKAVDVGGSSYTHESIVLVGGGCALVGEPTQFTGWQEKFNLLQNTAYECAKRQAVQHMTKRADLSRAAATASGYGDRQAIVEAQKPKLATTCRNPAIVSVRVPGGQDFKLGFLHAPGPGEKSQHGLKEPDSPWTEKLAGLYAEAVMSALNDEGLHAVLGDYNLRETGPTIAHMTWFSKDLGPTTCYKDSGDGVPEGGRYDRVYAKPEMCLEDKARKVANFGPNLTDHIAVGVVLGAPGAARKGKRAASDGADVPDAKRAKYSEVDAEPMQVVESADIASYGASSTGSSASHT